MQHNQKVTQIEAIMGVLIILLLIHLSKAFEGPAIDGLPKPIITILGATGTKQKM